MRPSNLVHYTEFYPKRIYHTFFSLSKKESRSLQEWKFESRCGRKYLNLHNLNSIAKVTVIVEKGKEKWFSWKMKMIMPEEATTKKYNRQRYCILFARNGNVTRNFRMNLEAVILSYCIKILVFISAPSFFIDLFIVAIQTNKPSLGNTNVLNYIYLEDVMATTFVWSKKLSWEYDPCIQCPNATF